MDRALATKKETRRLRPRVQVLVNPVDKYTRVRMLTRAHARLIKRLEDHGFRFTSHALQRKSNQMRFTTLLLDCIDAVEKVNAWMTRREPRRRSDKEDPFWKMARRLHWGWPSAEERRCLLNRYVVAIILHYGEHRWAFHIGIEEPLTELMRLRRDPRPVPRAGA